MIKMYEKNKLVKEYEKIREFANVPDGCRYPDCFHCIFIDCGVAVIKGENTNNQELIRSLYKTRLKYS